MKFWGGRPIIAVEPRKRELKRLKLTGANEVYNTKWEDWNNRSFTRPVIVIGNPPFSKAANHVELCFERYETGSFIAFLLRLSFLGSLDRATGFWKRRLESLKYIVPIVPRPQFVEGTSDNSEYGIYVWQIGHTMGPHVQPHLLWKAP